MQAVVIQLFVKDEVDSDIVDAEAKSLLIELQERYDEVVVGSVGTRDADDEINNAALATAALGLTEVGVDEDLALQQAERELGYSWAGEHPFEDDESHDDIIENVEAAVAERERKFKPGDRVRYLKDYVGHNGEGTVQEYNGNQDDWVQVLTDGPSSYHIAYWASEEEASEYIEKIESPVKGRNDRFQPGDEVEVIDASGDTYNSYLGQRLTVEEVGRFGFVNFVGREWGLYEERLKLVPKTGDLKVGGWARFTDIHQNRDQGLYAQYIGQIGRVRRLDSIAYFENGVLEAAYKSRLEAVEPGDLVGRTATIHVPGNTYLHERKGKVERVETDDNGIVTSLTIDGMWIRATEVAFIA